MTMQYKIGDLLYLQQRLYKKEEALIYKARIADLSDAHISIEMPLAEQSGKYGFFLEGSEIDVWINAQDGSKINFICTVLGRRKEPIPVTLLTHPTSDSIIRTQRREFIRVPCYEEIAIHPVKEGEFTPFLSKVTDVSGGGLAFSSLQKSVLTQGTEFKLWLSLKLNSGPIMHPTALGKLVRIIDPTENGLPYKFSVQFIEIAEFERQKLMRFCFERQLDINRKRV
jgi:c-di-GMP-binding flagellar brake protein YcgR